MDRLSISSPRARPRSTSSRIASSTTSAASRSPVARGVGARHRSIHCGINRRRARASLRGRGFGSASLRHRCRRPRPDLTIGAGEYDRGRSRWMLANRVGARLHARALELCALPHAASRRGRSHFLPRIGRHRLSIVQQARSGWTEDPRLRSRAIRNWLEGEESPPLPEPEARSHQRLLREFLGAHLNDDRPLRAFAVWEHERWSAA